MPAATRTLIRGACIVTMDAQGDLPRDLHIATLAGALNQLDCGTTTLVDWGHNNRTPEHNDAAIEALLPSGIRASFFHGTPKPDPKPGEQPFWETPHRRGGAARTPEGWDRLEAEGLLGRTSTSSTTTP